MKEIVVFNTSNVGIMWVMIYSNAGQVQNDSMI